MKIKIKFVKDAFGQKTGHEMEVTAEEVKAFGDAVVEVKEDAAAEAVADSVKEVLDAVDAKISVVEKKIAKAFKDRSVTVTNRVELDPQKGFKSLGHFLLAAKNGEFDRKSDDVAIHKATGASVGTDADGGYAVPDLWANSIFTNIVTSADIFSRTMQIPMSGPGSTLKLPAENVTTIGTNGLTVQQKTRAQDGAAITPTKPILREVSIDVNRMVILAPVTDDLLSDAIALGSFMDTVASRELAYRLNDNVLQGGTCMTGIIGHASAVVQLRTTANLVKYDDIRKMWGRKYGRAGSFVWIINQEVEPQLMTLSDGANQNLYFAPGRISDSPYGVLFGAPVLVSDNSSTLGVEGDVVLASLENYWSVTKGGVEKATSPHVYFDTAEQAFRWTFRVGGKPSLAAAITPASGRGTATRSPFVVLDDATT